MPPADNGLFEPADNGYGVSGTKSPNRACEALKLPGVELNTEYSSANCGVHPDRSSPKLSPRFCRGVSRTALGNTADVGVGLGLGGWVGRSPELLECAS
jgi:hypothetical protein